MKTTITSNTPRMQVRPLLSHSLHSHSYSSFLVPILAHRERTKNLTIENPGAKRAGYVEFDMTPLRNSGKIQKTPLPGRFPCWKFKGILKILVSGRNLKYEVKILLPNAEGETGREAGDVTLEGTVGQCSIAAAFKPGTE
jgi:hypothetical protein